MTEVVSSSRRCCPAHSHGHSTTAANSLKEFAFEMASSNVRYGPGVTREVGHDAVNIGAKKTLLVTDPNVRKLPPFTAALDALTKAGVDFDIYDEVHVEPTDVSFKHAINFAKQKDYDFYIAVGGGSVIDTAKAQNLYNSNREADFLDYVTPPVGRNLPVTHTVRPLIAVPTTSGTGSETTGVCVFDDAAMKIKVAIASPVLRPTLGLLDPDHVRHMPTTVSTFSGFDVFGHALESYTAIPYYERSPRATNPSQRAGFQGRNPISDVWSRHALHIIRKFFRRAVRDPEDFEARSQMHLAACFAGIGFGNAGVHLCHGMSYPIAGRVKSFNVSDYGDEPLVPHGLAVIMTAPAVFNFTATAAPERHLEAAELLGADVQNAHRADAGKILSDTIRTYMLDLNIPNGLTALGYGPEDVGTLASSTIPQKRTMGISPRQVVEEDLNNLFEQSLKHY